MLTTESLKQVRSAPTAEDAAVSWWIAALTNPRFESNGSPELAALAASAQLITPEQDPAAIERFRQALTAELKRAIAVPEGYTKGYTITLSVDYRPKGLLLEYAESAGLRIDMLSWPSKTAMEVNLEKVVVQEGWDDPVIVWRR